LNIQECIQAAARIQILLRDLHTGLARCFAMNRTLRESFLGLAREEAQRALDIRILVLDRKGAPWSDQAIEIIRQDLVATVAELSAMAGELHRDSSCFGPVSVVRRVIQVDRVAPVQRDPRGQPGPERGPRTPPVLVLPDQAGPQGRAVARAGAPEPGGARSGGLDRDQEGRRAPRRVVRVLA
jgi:hypothetical protein